MSPRILRLLLGVLLGTSPCLVRAQTIYNDGGIHTVNGPSGPIEVLDGSTLNIDSPASVNGWFPAPITGNPISIYGDSSSTINLTGGQVIATSFGSDYVLSGSGILATGSFTASGGLVQGGDGGRDAGYGLIAVGNVQISGGKFVGGNAGVSGEGPDNGGDGAQIGGSNAHVQISGGIFQGGDGNPAAFPGAALNIQSHIGMASITGGIFLGGSGGSMSGDSLFYETQNNPSISEELDVSGGSFSRQMATILFTSQDSFNFFGQGFSYDIEDRNVFLKGTLQDGNAIDVTVFNYTGFNVQLTNLRENSEELSIIGTGRASVPEPSSIVTLATGLAGLSVVAAYRLRRRR